MTPQHVLTLSAVLFTLGVIGVLRSRQAITILMCIELMLNAANLAFITFGQRLGYDGQIVAFFVMTVAAAEVAVGLGIIVSIFRQRKNIDVDEVSLLKG